MKSAVTRSSCSISQALKITAPSELQPKRRSRRTPETVRLALQATYDTSAMHPRRKCQLSKRKEEASPGELRVESTSGRHREPTQRDPLSRPRRASGAQRIDTFGASRRQRSVRR
ncbi:hypothetical protein MTO96_001441 [Rhipicephalus appendiculatus]